MSEYLSQKPGIRLIKSGTPEMVSLEKSYQCGGLKSWIIDLPVSGDKAELTLGRFEMRPSVDFPFFYTSLEVKTVLTGKIVVRDEDGEKYVGLPGDVFIFTPPHLVMFCAECDGTATFIGHRPKEPSFLPGFNDVVETPIPAKVSAWWNRELPN